ncbi:DMT family transporter [Janibacter corallicola]|uniref:DMT family transporter n=1 Tax=Janibacter corallicola TaxID=415212 RepID=UPI0008346470|nr:EamA family transporter [Janibacter corallicola]
MTRTLVAASAGLAAVAAAALWGTTGTSQALGPAGTDPVSVGTLRIVVGAITLVLLALATARRGAAPPSARPACVPAPVVVLLGGGCVASYQACFFEGVARSGVAVGTVIALGTAPLATGLLGLLLSERPTGRWAVATSAAVAGVVLLVAGSGADAPVDAVGIAAAVGAGLSYAGYTVAARTLLLRGARGTLVMAGLFVTGALLLLPTLVGADLTWLTEPTGLLMVLWLGVVATGLSYVLFQHGLARLSAGTVATLSLAEPVTATLLGVLVLDERLSVASATGIVVVLASLLLIAAPRRRPALPG